MKAQIIVDYEQYQTIEARVRSALHDLGDTDPSKAFKKVNEERDTIQQRNYSAVQGLRQLLAFLQPR